MCPGCVGWAWVGGVAPESNAAPVGDYVEPLALSCSAREVKPNIPSFLHMNQGLDSLPERADCPSSSVPPRTLLVSKRVHLITSLYE